MCRISHSQYLFPLRKARIAQWMHLSCVSHQLKERLKKSMQRKSQAGLMLVCNFRVISCDICFATQTDWYDIRWMAPCKWSKERLKAWELYRLGQGDVIILNVHGWNRCMFVKLLIPPKVCWHQTFSYSYLWCNPICVSQAVSVTLLSVSFVVSKSSAIILTMYFSAVTLTERQLDS